MLNVGLQPSLSHSLSIWATLTPRRRTRNAQRIKPSGFPSISGFTLGTRTRVEPRLSKNTIDVGMSQVVNYSDGACEPNPVPGGWGAVLIYAGHSKEISGGSGWATNN